jgi:hypothetical protein
VLRLSFISRNITGFTSCKFVGLYLEWASSQKLRMFPMPKLIAIIGGLTICAGIDLLWQSRLQIRYWVETYLGFFGALRRRQLSPRVAASGATFMKRRGSVQVLLGLGFVLFLGPLLLVLGLSLVLYRQ